MTEKQFNDKLLSGLPHHRPVRRFKKVWGEHIQTPRDLTLDFKSFSDRVILRLSEPEHRRTVTRAIAREVKGYYDQYQNLK